MKFSDLKLDSTLVSAIEKLGYSECTQIQTLAMNPVLEGKDLSGLAQTGTGKTAAFLIPLMERILRAKNFSDSMEEEQKQISLARGFKDWRAQNFILILVPTRELAEQVYENIVKLSEFSGLRGVSVYGGTGYEKQKEALKNSVEFVVATPGRLIDLYKEHFVDLKQVRAIIFDEADRMFDMGFKDDMKFILQRVPRERQVLMFSATLNFDVINTAYQFGAEPIEIDVSRDQAKAENVKDEIFHVGQDDKPMYLLSMIKKYNPKQTIIFSNYKANVEKIAAFLTGNGIPAMAISSLLSQAQRNKVIELFKAENENNILVATDVAARGLDIKGVDMVINFDLPNDAESYVHRIGRTGRAGTEGVAYSLVSDRDVEALSRIEGYLKNRVAVGWVEEEALLKDFKAFHEFDSYRPHGGGGRSHDRQGGGAHGDREHHRGGGPRGPRHEGRGPRHEKRRDHRNDRNERFDKGASSGERPDRSERHRDDRNRDDRSRDDRQRDGRRPEARHHKGKKPHTQGSASHPRKPHPHHKPHHKKPHSSVGHKKQQTNIVQKVTGFFKKLFN